MKKVFTILIADRNPRVRGFLQREMSREGYRILLAENARDLLEWPPDKDPIDLVILDPDLPDAADAPLMSLLRQRMPLVPVILHAHPSHHLTEPEAVKPLIVVEKGGSSVERLKEVAGHLLKGSQPAGFNTQNETPFEQ